MHFWEIAFSMLDGKKLKVYNRMSLITFNARLSRKCLRIETKFEKKPRTISFECLHPET